MLINNNIDQSISNYLLKAGANMSLYEDLGGRGIIERVHKIFYDKVYAHPWIGQFFKEIDQTHIENQQTDFMVQSFGGPADYQGKFPVPAHKHMMISEELYELRYKLLTEAIDEAGVPEPMRSKWLKIDYAFKNAIVKKSIDECEKRYTTDEILDYKKAA